jgi:uncharacterized membrane protein YkvA (DUF1232 family)
MALSERLRAWARRIKRDGATLWFAARDPRTPWLPKALGYFVVGYALSPIDLIPDFVPVLGYLDDVVLLPVLIWLAVRLIPQTVIDDSRARADQWITTTGSRPVSKIGAVVIVLIWIAVALAAGRWIMT